MSNKERLLIAFSKIIYNVIGDACCPIGEENKPYCDEKARELLEEVKKYGMEFDYNNDLTEEIELWWANLSKDGKREIAEYLGYFNYDEMWEQLPYEIKLDTFNDKHKWD